MTWTNCNLGEIAVLNYGKSLPERVRIPGEFPVYGSGGCIGTHNKSFIKGPGIVVGRKGTVGETYWVDADFCPIDTTYYATPKSSNVGLKYLYYLLKNLPLTEMNTDAAVPGLNRENAYRVKFQIPDLSIQKNITSILSAYDDLIENNHRRKGLLEEAARLLYREWFVHFRFPGHEHVKIIDGVPEGWKQGTVRNLGAVVTGKTPSKKVEANFGDDVPFIKTPDMHGNAFVISPDEWLSEQGANTQKNKFLPEGSILVSCIGTVGAVSMNAIVSQTNQQINAVIPKFRHWQFFSYFALKSIKSRLEALGGGATMANVNKTKFVSVPILLSDDSLIADFHEIVEPQFKAIEKLARLNIELAKARDLLLPRLMDGRLEI